MNTHQIIQNTINEYGDDFLTAPRAEPIYKEYPYTVRLSKAISSLLGGRPVAVGRALAERWPDAERLDGRPGMIARCKGLSIGQTARIYVTAIQHDLWERGYGSPYSPSIDIIQYCLRHGINKKEDIETINEVFGGYNECRLPRNALGIAKLFIRLRSALRRLLYNVYNYNINYSPPEKFVFWAVKAYTKLNRRPNRKHWWAVLGALMNITQLDLDEEENPRVQFLTQLNEELKRPYHELIIDYASAKFLWKKLVGLNVDYRCTTKPYNIKYLKRFLKDTDDTIATYECARGIDISDDMLLPLNNAVTAFRDKTLEVFIAYCNRHHKLVQVSNKKLSIASGVDIVNVAKAIHDFGQFVVSNPATTEEAGAYVIRNLKVLKNPSLDFSDVFLLLNNWSSELKDLKWSEAVKEARKVVYSGIDQDIANVAAELKLTNQRALQYQEWIRKNPHKTREIIPSVEVLGKEVNLEGDWKLYKLDKEDMRGPLLGLYTDCCQHPEGAGAFCARHGWMNSTGGFFVVEYKGKIVAQSWAWIDLKHDLLCFDNIETLSDAYGEGILALYKEAAKKLGPCFKNITVGEGHSDIELYELKRCEFSHVPASLSYSDAVIQYNLLSEGK